ncbi:hypothetical protein D3C77_760240 [compost metagenome]
MITLASLHFEAQIIDKIRNLVFKCEGEQSATSDREDISEAREKYLQLRKYGEEWFADRFGIKL